MKPGPVVWITGVPASGKTTLARSLVQRFQNEGHPTLWLDSDELRDVMTPEAEYSRAERDTFYATIGYLAKVASMGGVRTVISATAPVRDYRRSVRSEVEQFVEIWLKCSPEELRKRDFKGLYSQADEGAIANLPGAGATYETPEHPDIALDTTGLDSDEVLKRINTELARLHL